MDYTQELEKAITYIENNLTNHLDLETIAEQVNISVFHFHRIFKSVVDETIMGYVRKRRLTEALVKLVRSDLRILDVALEYGFESQESFSRAFKSYFGVSPGKARKSKDSRNHDGIYRFSVEILRNTILADRQEHHYLHLPALKLVGVPCKFEIPYKETTYGPDEAWETFSTIIEQVPHKVPNGVYGANLYPKDFGPENNVFHHVPSTAVEKFESIPNGMIAFEIPESDYVCYRYNGPTNSEVITQIFLNIYGKWLLDVPYALEGEYDLSFYSEGFDPNSEDSYMTICIPIRKEE